MAFPNIKKEKFKNYTADEGILKLCLTHLDNISDLSIKNNLDFLLVGHLGLILLSNKFYRDINDLDILIPIKHANSWGSLLYKDWDVLVSENYILAAHMFFKSELQKYASVDITSSTVKETDATIYQIKENNFKVYKKSSALNSINLKIIQQPIYVCHDPSKINMVEIIGNQFKLNFYTNSVGQYFKSYVIFYDESLKYKNIVECLFSHDVKNNKTTQCYWTSPLLNLDKYENCFYKIITYKHQFRTTLQHKITKMKIEFWIDNDISNSFQQPIQYSREPSNIMYNANIINFDFNNKNILVSNPNFCFDAKYKRQKDIDDYSFFRDLLYKYQVRSTDGHIVMPFRQ